MRYWLFKSEPETFSIDTLNSRPHHTDHWDGVRNYQVRNMLRDEIKKGDLGFFYHSNCTPPGVAGIVEVVRDGYPDFSAQDPDSPYFDPSSSSDNPRWFMVDVTFVKKFPHFVSLEEIKRHPRLENMLVIRKGSRLSITPVGADEWKVIMKLGDPQ